MDKSNKYLFTIRSLTGGGAERVVSVLASNMVQDGYDVSIIAYDKTEHDYTIDENVKIYYMPKAKKNIFGKLSRISDMRKLIKQIQPDIIIPFVGTVLYVSYLASFLDNIPLIRTIRNSPWHESDGIIQKKFRNYLNKKAIAIMVQNDEQIEFFPSKFKNKIYVVPNPLSNCFVETEKNNYSNEIRSIVTAGRLVKQKNHKLLITAFSSIVKKFSNVRLEIYGVGVEEENLQDIIKKLELEDKCFLMGRSDNMENILINADLFVMTSDFEGMPNSLMEAMTVGIPSLSSDCKTGPKSFITHKENGLLFKTGSVESLEKELEWALDNPEQLNIIGKQGRASMLNRYTYNSVHEAILEMLNSIKLKD